ncbi:MAG: hypothetical protein D6732_00685, partial [Methanobacteriota archaeon]
MNKNNLLSILIFLSVPLFAQSFWHPQPSPTTVNLNSLFFLDSLRGWVAGDSGVIIHTVDGGNSWEFQSTGLNSD